MDWQTIKTWIKRLCGSHPELAYLKKFSLLQDFTDRELYMFSQLLHLRNYSENEFIYKEDFPLAVIYLILQGEIEVMDNQANVMKSVILHKYQFLGLVDMYNESRRNGSARALKDCIVLAVSRQDFSEFIKNNPRCGVKLMTNLASILSRYISRISQPSEVNK